MPFEIHPRREAIIENPARKKLVDTLWDKMNPHGHELQDLLTKQMDLEVRYEKVKELARKLKVPVLNVVDFGIYLTRRNIPGGTMLARRNPASTTQAFIHLMHMLPLELWGEEDHIYSNPRQIDHGFLPFHVPTPESMTGRFRQAHAAIYHQTEHPDQPRTPEVEEFINEVKAFQRKHSIK